jgi:hypothetical protein
MLAKVGGITCSFNATISEKNNHEIPAMVSGSRQHVDIVHTMGFILFRSPEIGGDFEFYAEGEKITPGETDKDTEWGGSHILMA